MRTISSYVLACGTSSGSTPQMSAICLYVRGTSVSTRIGTLGRCDATMRALNPLFVNTMSAGDASIRTAALLAAAIANSVDTAVPRG